MPLIYKVAKNPIPATKLSNYRASLTAPWQNTIELLQKEVRHLCGYNADVVIELNCVQADISVRGGAIVRTPKRQEARIVIPTETKGVISMECSAFRDWQSNVRAIGMTLERLRMVELYGCADQNQAYVGFAQLPNNDTSGDEAWAKNYINEKSGGLGHDRVAYLEAVKKVHPDCVGGTHEMFLQVQKAKDILGL